MKCAYREVTATAKLNRIYYEYGMLYLEYIDAALGCALIDRFGWGKVRLQKLYDNERQNALAMIDKYMPDTMMTHSKRRGRHRADENELLTDAKETAIYAMSKELKACGFEVDLSPFDNTTNADKLNGIKHHWYNSCGKSAGISYVLAALIYLRRDYGFGTERLTRVYEALAPMLQEFTDSFFEVAGEKLCDLKLGKLQATLVEHGVEMLELDENGDIKK